MSNHNSKLGPVVVLISCVLLTGDLDAYPVQDAPQLVVQSPATTIWSAGATLPIEVEIQTALPTYAFLDWEDSLLAWWRFDNDGAAGESRGHVRDWSGHGHDGTVSRGPIPIAEGKFGGAFRFEGQDGGIDIKRPISLSADEDYTFAAWIRASDNGRHKNLLTGTGPGGTTYRWYLHVGGVLAVGFQDNSMDDPFYCTFSSEISYDAFHHVAMVLNRGEQTLQWYIDGKADQSGDLSAVQRDVDITALNLGGGYDTFLGTIDEFLIFERALPATEIAALHRSSRHFSTAIEGLEELRSHCFLLRAVDNAGRCGETARRAVTVDRPKSPPRVELLSPLSETRRAGATQEFRIRAVATNDGIDLTHATLYLGYDGRRAADQSVSLSGTEADASFVKTGLREGRLTWNVLVRDQDGNEGFAGADHTLEIGRTEYHVSPGGDDSFPGTSDQPFRTIQRGADQAMAGDTCVVHAGTYRESVVVPRSGNALAPIVFRAAPSEKVVISGAEEIRGFTPYQGAIYRSPLAWDLGQGQNQVFVDSRMVLEARTPNASEVMQLKTPVFEIERGTAQGSSGTIVDHLNLTQAAGYWNGAVVHATWQPRYHSITGAVTASQPGRLDIAWHSTPYGDIDHYGVYYLVGNLNALDAPGEWYYDATARSLYLWAPDGADPRGLSVEAKRRELAFDLRGRSFVTISGIDLFACTVISDADSRHLLLDRMRAEYVSHYTLIDQGNMASGPKGTRDSGIVLDGPDNTIQYSEIAFSAGNGVSLLGDRNRVNRCRIHEVNYAVTEAAAIHCGNRISYDQQITGNRIYRTGRSGINHSSSRRLKLLGNDISHTSFGAEPWDLGATYSIVTDGEGTEIAYNYIHDYRSEGIYLDYGNWNFSIHHNVVTAEYISPDRPFIALLINENNGNNRVFNNTVLGPVYFDILPDLLTGPHQFRNNIASRNYLRRVDDDGGAALPGEIVASNNIELNDLSPAQREALFADSSGRDFHLKAGSPAIDQGASVGPSRDFDGAPIPFGSAPDIGAFERYGIWSEFAARFERLWPGVLLELTAGC